VLSACFVGVESLVTGTRGGELLLWDMGGKKAGSFGSVLKVRVFVCVCVCVCFDEAYVGVYAGVCLFLFIRLVSFSLIEWHNSHPVLQRTGF